MVIRFEMPFDVWCEGCQRHIAKGVRFNAEKKAVGKYFSTKIWNFKMRCVSCSNSMEIETDPQAMDYVCKVGVRRKVETWEARAEDDVQPLADEEETKRLADDPFYRLEHQTADTAKAQQAAPVLAQLYALTSERTADDFSSNSLLRKRLREEKKELRQLDEEAQSKGLGIRLLPQAEDDLMQARLALLSRPSLPAAQHRTLKKLEVSASSIFGGGLSKKPAANNPKLELIKKQKIGLGTSFLPTASLARKPDAPAAAPLYNVRSKH